LCGLSVAGWPRGACHGGGLAPLLGIGAAPRGIGAAPRGASGLASVDAAEMFVNRSTGFGAAAFFGARAAGFAAPLPRMLGHCGLSMFCAIRGPCF